MKFYGRQEEIALLHKAREISHRFSQFTVVTGRRRVGKTDAERYDRKRLEVKVEAFLEKHPEKRILRRRIGALSLKDM